MSNKSLSIISGATRGLGKQIALKQAGTVMDLVLLGRNTNELEKVKSACEKNGSAVSLIEADLAKNDYQSKLQAFLNTLEAGVYVDVFLFNNASMIEPISLLANTDSKVQEELIQVNLNSAIWLASEFLRLSQRITPKKAVVVNISSGVSLKPIQGWSLYCISKAAINMLTSCIAEEGKNSPFKVLSVAINPGALDTDMQKTIRSSDETESPIAQKFRDIHEKGGLKSVESTASKILEIVRSEAFQSGQFLDFNTL